MAYVALYRKWRPQNFESLVGQAAVKQTLHNALSTGKIAHAYLFTGPRGTGKTSTARILAKALNCKQGPTPTPCDTCENCRRITDGTSMDVFEIDAASNRGIDEIKALREQLAFSPVDSKYKIYIIDEVHMLTTEAFNALLKTLEEPPAHVIFILATTDPQKIPATIHSRCQRFDFHRVTLDEIVEHLAKVAVGSDMEAEAEALRLIAIQSEGGMRDALSLLDQCAVMDRHVTVEIVRSVLGIVGREALHDLALAIGEKRLQDALDKLKLLLSNGKEAKQVLLELAEYFRAVLFFKATPAYAEIYLTDSKENLATVAALFGPDRLLAVQERLHSAVLDLKNSMRPRIVAELCLFDLCRAEGSTLAALSARIEELERKLAQGVPVAASVPAQAVAKPSVVAQSVAKDLPQAEELVFVEQPQIAKEPVSVAKESVSVAKPALAKEPVSVAKPATQAVATEEFAGDFAAGEDYWKQALELLQGEKKIAMVSCARNGRVHSFVNNLLQIAFKADFFCNRMNSADYRSTFEDALLRIARTPIRLQAVNIASTATQCVAPVAKPAPVSNVEENALPENLRKAMNAFGGTVQEVKE